MTREQKKRLQRKIIAARAVLMREHPFFALLLMHIRFVAIPNMQQLSTNGVCIFFSPKQLEKYTLNELCFLLCHQIMHIVMGDIWRPFIYSGDEYHYERDLMLDEILRQCGIDRKACVYVRSIPQKSDTDNDTDDENEFEAEDDAFFLYNDDKPKPKYMIDNDEFWNDKDYYGNECDVILDALDDIKASKPNLSLHQLWKNRISQYSSLGKSTDFDLISQFQERMLGKEKKSTLDWRKILYNFLQEEVFDYSFCPPDKRMDDTEFFLPDFNEKDFVAKNILFMVDTSGSMDDNQISAAYAEIKNAIEQFNGKLKGYIGFFDTEVVAPISFECVSDIDEIIPYGGGGTDFRCIFKYVQKYWMSEKPSCIVILTDGWGEYPRKSETMNIPLLWLINNPEALPPYGKTVQIT